MPEYPPVFVDTSIQIARKVHGKETKRSIADRLKRPRYSVTGEVVKQEFKRRLLGEAKYLLNLISRFKTIEIVQAWVNNSLPPQLARKRNICLDMLATIFHGEGEPDLTDRAKSYLRTLLKHGMDQFEREVDSVVREVGCMCSRVPVIEKKPYEDYDLGKDRCTKAGSACGVASLLQARQADASRILADLKALPEAHKTGELRRIEEYLDRYLSDPDRAAEGDPCLKVGDLLIALESAGVATFYTMNYRESQVLCRSMGQTLIYRPPNFTRAEVECPISDPDWDSRLAQNQGRT